MTDAGRPVVHEHRVPRDREHGQALALFALTVSVLLVSVGLVLDGGYAWVQSRETQNAADMAALAGARVVRLGRTESVVDGDVASALVGLAASNNSAAVTGWGTMDGPMYTNGQGIPLPGSYVGSGCTTASCAVASSAPIPDLARGVTVTARRAWPTYFLKIVGVDEWSADAEAVARFSRVDAGGGACAICILGLGTVGAAAAVLTANGSILINTVAADAAFSRITADPGSIEIDGILGGGVSVDVTAHDGSVRVSGLMTGVATSDFTASSGTIDVGGDLALLNWSNATASAISVAGSSLVALGSTTNPTPSNGGPVNVTLEDPFASVSQPVNPDPGAVPEVDFCIVSCTRTIVPESGKIHSVNVAGNSTVTLHPGLYGLVDLSIDSTAYLEPGTYYFAGLAGGAVADVSSQFVGLGPVTLVFLDQTHLAVAAAPGLQIDAPDEGQPASAEFPYPGIAILAAKGNLTTFTLANSSLHPLDGAVYAPDAVLTTAALTDVLVNARVVVGTYLSAAASSLTVALQDQPALGRVQLVR